MRSPSFNSCFLGYPAVSSKCKFDSNCQSLNNLNKDDVLGRYHSYSLVLTRVGNYIPTFFIDIRYNFFHFIDIIYRYKI